MRILYLNPVGVIGGAERVLLGLLAGISKRSPKYELHLWTGSEGPLLSAAEALGARVLCLPLPKGLLQAGDSGLQQGSRLQLLRWGISTPRMAASALRYALCLRDEVNKLQPDVIHSNGIKSHMLLSALPASCPTLWHLHDFISARPFARRVMRLLSHHVDAAIAVSHAVEEDARRIFRHMPVEVIANGVDTEAFSPGPVNGAVLDALAGLNAAPPGTVRVGLVATYAKWKGHELFFRAAALVLRGSPAAQVRFYVVGGPVYATHGSQWTQPELGDMAVAMGLEGRIGFVPFTLDVANIYRSLDVVVHASVRPEPFGMTIVEAMACGRPVIAVASGGAAELISAGEAISLPKADEALLAAAISALVADEPRRKELGAAARQAALKNFSTFQRADQVLSLYRRLSGREGG